MYVYHLELINMISAQHILIDEVQNKGLTKVNNINSEGNILNIYCDSELTDQEKIELNNIILNFDEKKYNEYANYKLIPLVTTQLKINSTGWINVCSWFYKGSYIENNKNLVIYSHINKINNNDTYSFRIYDSKFNKVIKVIENLSNTDDEELIVDLSDEINFPITYSLIELQVKSSNILNTVFIQSCNLFTQ